MAYCRKLLGFSKKEMAKRLSTTPNTLTKYENNTALPSLLVVYELSQIMDIPMGTIVSDVISLDEFEEVCTKPLAEIVVEIFDRILTELDNKMENEKQ